MNDALENSLTLQSDVEVILLECHRDRPGLFAQNMTREVLAALASRVAGQLGPLISGRYVSHRYAMEQMQREQRNEEVWAAFTGNNYAELMRRFGLSRRLVYAIIAQKRKDQSPQ